jgi:hypothetical protein
MDPETSLLDAFKYAPIPFLLATFAAGLSLSLGIVALAALGTSRKATGIAAGVALALALGVVLIGVLGWASGNAMVEAAVATPGLSTDDIVRLRAKGGAEAMMPLTFSMVAAAIPGLLAVVALGVALMKRTQRPH